MKISRIRLSDKTSRLHPRHVVPKPAQAHEPEVPVKVREWIRPALASPDLVLEAQYASSDSTRRVACAVTTPPWAVAPDELRIIAASARAMGLRIHSHLSETRDYVDYRLATFGKRPVPWMADHDWLGADVWFGRFLSF